MKQMKSSSILVCLIRISEGEKRERRKIFEEAIPENFTELMNDITLEIIIQKE